MGFGKKVTLGFKYYLGAHMVVCHGPVDEVKSIRVGQRKAWTGSVTGNATININNPDLFGGEKKEGGIVGAVDVLMGGPTQVKNPYLIAKLGAIIPAFRGVLSFVLKQVYICAMSPYPKPWAFEVKRIPAKAWYLAKADINSGSANPIHIIYECLTDSDWGMGYPASAIDNVSFMAAADTCFSEGLGMSLFLNNQDPIEKFVYDVLSHANGLLYTRLEDGKFAVRLFRDDYVVGSLPLYDETNVIKLESFERPTYGELPNEIIVSFRPRGTLTDDTVTVHDNANIQNQQGIVSQTKQYPGIDNHVNAARVALRDLRQNSTPLAKIRIHLNRKAHALRLGDVFKFSWAEHELSELVCRILAIDYGDLKNNEIIVDAVEDVFGLPNSTYIGNQVSSWVDPVQAPTNFTVMRTEEATYYDVVNTVPTADFSLLDDTSCFLIGYAGEPTQFTTGVEYWVKPPTGVYTFSVDGVVSAIATLTAAITPTTTTFSISNISSRCQFVEVGTFAYIDNEIVRVDVIDAITGSVTIARGILDTVPAAHSLGAVILFGEQGQMFDEAERSSGATLKTKLLMRTGIGLFDIASATELSNVLAGRFSKPYPPGLFRITGLAYPIATQGEASLTWAHRDRTQQIVKPYTDTNAVNIGPEVGVTYTVRVYRENGTTLLRTDAAIPGTSWTWPTEVADTAGLASSLQRFTVTSVRSTIESHQPQSWFTQRTGVGYNLGDYLGGQ